MRKWLPRLEWAPVAVVTVITVLAATTVTVMVAPRHVRPGPVANAVPGQSPAPSPSTVPPPVLSAPSSVQISAPSAGVVWALVDYDALFTSDDGGSHWEQRSLPIDAGVRPSITFIDASEGWLLAPGESATQCEVQLADLWHTTDGARSWQDLGARIDKSQCKSGIWFVDSTHGFVTAWSQGRGPTLYRTSDAGDHWTFSAVPDNPLFVTRPGGFTMHVNWMKAFGPTIYIEASGSQDDPTWHNRDFIYLSRDGGASWTWKQKLASPYTYLVSEARWLQLAPDVMESVNGGQQFHPFTSNLHAAPPLQAMFPETSVGYLTTAAGILRTSDGGATWTQLSAPWSAGVVAPPSPSASPIAPPTNVSLSAPSANVLWALVSGEDLFRSVDGSASWQLRPWVPYQAGFGAPVMSFADDLNGWALLYGVSTLDCSQASAQLWRTSDAGATWSLASEVTAEKQSNAGLPFEQCKSYMFFATPKIGFVAGHDATSRPLISRTVDGGSTWTRSRLPDPTGFTSGGGSTLTVVDIRSFGLVVLAVAVYKASTYVFKSIDMGATWAYLSTATQWTYEQVTIVTSTHWVNIQSRIQTDDAGRTVRALSTDYPAALVGSRFTFPTSEVGYGVFGAELYRTADGGAHWARIHTPGT